MMILTASMGRANDWVDTWIDQKTVTGPDYYSTQQRGYGSFGSFSARWQNQAEQVFSYTKPRYNIGCGGVDLFLGGFSFMEFDHLVKKMEKIMGPAAAAFAFDIAMSTLNAQASKSIGKFLAIMDRLNQLQLDECSAGKTVAAYMSPIKSPADKSAALSEFLQDSGAEDLWTDISNMGKGGTADSALTQSGASVLDTVTGCPTDLKDIVFTEGYIFDHLGEKHGYSSDQINLIRGLVGDVLISTDSGGLDYVAVSPCTENYSNVLDTMINGDIQIKTPTGCTALGDIHVGQTSYTNLKQWAATMIEHLGQKLASKTALLTDEEGFVSMVPLPVFSAIRSEISQSGDNTAQIIINSAAAYSDYVASIVAYNMLGDLAAGIQEALSTALKLQNAQKGAAAPNNQANCKIELSADGFALLLEKKHALIDIMRRVYPEFETKIAQINTTLENNRILAERSEMVQTKIREQFGHDSGPNP